MAIFENPLPNEIPSESIGPTPFAGIVTNKFTGFPQPPVGSAGFPVGGGSGGNTGGISAGGANDVIQDLQSATNGAPPAKTLNSDNKTDLSVSENTPAAQFVDNQLWKIAITVTNFSPPVKPVFIPGNYIHELVLEHNVLDPCYWRGSVIITSNRFGILEGKDADDNINLEMLFRGDGKDEMLIEISPLFSGSVELPPETWEVKSSFIVYDTEDIPWRNGSTMAKKIYFWHKAYNLMLERGSPYSTSYHTNLNNIYTATNENRMLPVGLAIKKLFEDAGMSEYIDYTEWDDGDITSKLLHSASAGHTVLETLYDLLPYYVSADGGPGFLYFHRGRNKFQMIGLKKFFEKAGIYTPGEYYYETFYLGIADAGTDNTTITPNKTPIIDTSNYDYAIQMKKYNLIKDNTYTLTEGSATDSMEAGVSHMVHTYDYKNKQFIVYYKDSEIKNHKEYFKKNFTDKLLPGARGEALIVLNSAKKKQFRVNQRFESSIDKTVELVSKVGRNFLTLSALFLNLGISFRVQGSTHRHAGRFIGIEKSKSSDNKYDYRLLGQWFVTTVTTRWEKGQLYNEITANKVSSFDNLRFNEDV